MKKLTICLALAILAMSGWAEGHMKFKGIEMTGSAADFATQLENKGFTKLGTMENITLFTGSFSGYDQCNIMLTSDNGEVGKIVVMFPACNSWMCVNEMYSVLKTRLTEKYGAPAIEKMDWHDKYNPNPSDAIKYIKIISQECEISTCYISELGEIDLEIRGTASSGAHVCLSYFDMEQQLKKLQSATDDL